VTTRDLRGTRPALVGLGLTLAYALVCVATVRMTGHDVRPLFEGIGPNAPYRWVNPPKEFAAGNVKPTVSSTDVLLEANGSQSAGLLSGDSQVVVNLDAGAVPARAGNETVSARFVPIDPARLGSLPRPLRPDGNAYRVQFNYRPTGQRVSTLLKPANMLMIVPEPADTILHSGDGRTWQKLESRHEPGSGGVSAPFAGPGYYIAGTTRPPPQPVASPGRGYGTAAVVMAVALIAVALAWLPYLVPRIRRGRT
jgi:hypothetical protein